MSNSRGRRPGRPAVGPSDVTGLACPACGEVAGLVSLSQEEFIERSRVADRCSGINWRVAASFDFVSWLWCDLCGWGSASTAGVVDLAGTR